MFIQCLYNLDQAEGHEVEAVADGEDDEREHPQRHLFLTSSGQMWFDQYWSNEWFDQWSNGLTGARTDGQKSGSAVQRRIWIYCGGEGEMILWRRREKIGREGGRER